jgi:hypothetical protein
VRAVESAPPAADLLERIEKLQAAASAGDREAVIAALRGVVPAYTPAAAAAPVGAGLIPSGSR